MRQFPGRQIDTHHCALLHDRYCKRNPSFEDRLNRDTRISHYDHLIVSRISIVSPPEQIPTLPSLRDMNYVLRSLRHRAALLTIAETGISLAARLGPLAPSAGERLSNADTPGINPGAPPSELLLTAGTIPIGTKSGRTGTPGNSSDSIAHSLSASAAVIAIGTPRAESCC